MEEGWIGIESRNNKMLGVQNAGPVQHAGIPEPSSYNEGQDQIQYIKLVVRSCYPQNANPEKNNPSSQGDDSQQSDPTQNPLKGRMAELSTPMLMTYQAKPPAIRKCFQIMPNYQTAI
eukprot:scaffold14097_cov93-Cylindrotheca_fusiformis.AAC.1